MSGTRMSTTGGQHTFARIPSVNIERSVFNRSCGLKTTFNAGYLIPFFVDEALPGDTFDMRVAAFGRMATMIRPVMDNMYMDMFFFAVPNRLLWVNWQKFNGEQRNPGDSTDFVIPKISQGIVAEQSLWDYFGLPMLASGTMPDVSALPFRAYNLIYNEWFRDENLCPRAIEHVGNGPDAYADYELKRRGKRHDYFTSCLPWPQKGDSVALPLLGTAPVSGTMIGQIAGDTPYTLGGDPGTSQAVWGTPPSTGAILGGTAGAYAPMTISGLTADLGQAVSATINDLREAFQVQRLLERDARGGTRYTEILRSHFGVISPDARLQRPEYLGGGTIPINVNPIASTFENAETGLGDLGAIGTFGTNKVAFRQSFTEHCTIIGLLSVRADLSYQQGLERMWSRKTRYDFYWPAFAHLGEQPVLNKEIFTQGNSNDDLVFGYQERYAEYRYKPSLITGRMRSSSATPLDSWHLAQDFSALPALNQSFIEENPPVDRVIAVTSALEPQFLADFYFSFKCARPMPVFGVPGLIDHF